VWCFERKLDCAVMILQKEFANRLIAPVGSEDYGWLTVFSCLHGEVALLDVVPKEMFYPQPKVDSKIIALTHWSKSPFQINDEKFLLQMLKWLFTQRNRKLGKALAPFLRSQLKISKMDAEKIALNVPFHDRRARELSPKVFGELANAVAN
jgi:16S rRNA (adenine1518-N6/adenine1519-N6)-dimethyltransferase